MRYADLALWLPRRGAGRGAGQLAGTIQNDILKEFMVRNTYIYPPAVDTRCLRFAYTSAKGAQLHLHFRLSHPEAGATAQLELAYAPCDGVGFSPG